MTTVQNNFDTITAIIIFNQSYEKTTEKGKIEKNAIEYDNKNNILHIADYPDPLAKVKNFFDNLKNDENCDYISDDKIYYGFVDRKQSMTKLINNKIYCNDIKKGRPLCVSNLETNKIKMRLNLTYDIVYEYDASKELEKLKNVDSYENPVQIIKIQKNDLVLMSPMVTKESPLTTEPKTEELEEDSLTPDTEKKGEDIISPSFARNVLISGTPGCGKSYFVDNYAIPSILSKSVLKETHVFRTTFTEGLTYDDFFGCYKPTMSIKNDTQSSEEEKIVYKFTPGVFCKAVKEALAQSNEKFILVIEEINRGHVYEVLGDVFQLLDRKYPSSEVDDDGFPSLSSTTAISLSEEAHNWFKKQLEKAPSGNKIIDDLKAHGNLRIPENLYIICTMNNADVGVGYLDTAFKRRFSYAYMDPDGIIYGDDTKIPGMSDPNVSKISFTNRLKFEPLRTSINSVLADKEIPEDRHIGKYFMHADEKTGEVNTLDFIVTVIGYLIQNVLRGNERLYENIFTQEDEKTPKYPKSLSDVLHRLPKTCKKDGDIISKILNPKILHQPEDNSAPQTPSA